MSEVFDELITGLNEAVAIERGEYRSRSPAGSLAQKKRHSEVGVSFLNL